jgi:uncharacterized repeat protein (TIGR03803 family)
MHEQRKFHSKFRHKVSSRVSAFAMLFALILLATHIVQAQRFSVLYKFTGGADGSIPDAGVTVGPSGTLYGTTAFGGNQTCSSGCGTVFKLNQVNSSWVFSSLYEFNGHDGWMPTGGVVIGPNGALYGTTSFGGVGGGVVFEMRPPATFCRAVQCYWNETILHNFTGTPDGASPQLEKLTFDQAGDIYGTTYYGGTSSYGTVFKLAPSGSGYTESVIHSFGFGAGGTYPEAGVVLDTAGNVYGTTEFGGTGTECMDNCGTVFQLVPSGGGWTENVLVNFDFRNGESPLANPIIDASGNLYGTAGIVYKLAPSGGGFTESVIYTFNSYCGDQSALTMDAAGNLFGVCDTGPAPGPPSADGVPPMQTNSGWVFELTNCSQTCMVIDLHNFSGRDGASPVGAPVLDANGNLYGTTAQGGMGICNGAGCGVVWEIAGVGVPRKN